MKVCAVSPGMALPGGVVRIEVEGVSNPLAVSARVDDRPVELIGLSTSVLTTRIPEEARGELLITDGGATVPVPLLLGNLVATELHPVANPVVDQLGNIFVTFSGTRGESVPFGVFRVSPQDVKEPFLADIVNPTGLAFGPEGHLYVSSRQTGEIYRCSLDKQVEKFVDGLGLATGIAFDASGTLFVGDRSGTVFRISPDKDVETFCELEPSVSAYHLAVGPEGDLYVTGPTLATQDAIYRVPELGAAPEVFFKGLGRPQGLGFDDSGHLMVAASFRGKRGLYRFANSEPQLYVAGPMLVGFCWAGPKTLYMVDNSSLYRLSLPND